MSEEKRAGKNQEESYLRLVFKLNMNMLTTFITEIRLI